MTRQDDSQVHRILRRHSNETVLTETMTGRAHLLGATAEVEVTAGAAEVRVEVAEETVDIGIAVNLGALGHELVIQLDRAVLAQLITGTAQ